MSNTEHKSVHFLIKEDPTFSMFTASNSKYPLIEWMVKMERFADEHAQNEVAKVTDELHKDINRICQREQETKEMLFEQINRLNNKIKQIASPDVKTVTEVKTPEQVLTEIYNSDKHKGADMPYWQTLDMVLDAIESYHAQFKPQTVTDDIDKIKADFYLKFREGYFQNDTDLIDVDHTWNYFESHLTQLKQEGSEWISVDVKPELGERFNVVFEDEDGYCVDTAEWNNKKQRWERIGVWHEFTGIKLYKPLPKTPSKTNN